MCVEKYHGTQGVAVRLMAINTINYAASPILYSCKGMHIHLTWYSPDLIFRVHVQNGVSVYTLIDQCHAITDIMASWLSICRVS